MVSRRTFFTISMMMAVLFFLFVASGVIKEKLNDYDVNSYAMESVLKKDSAWSASKDDSADVILIGSHQKSEISSVAEQFCVYTKRKMEVYNNVSDYTLPEDNRPHFMLLDSEGIDFDKDTEVISEWASNGVNIIFGNLPDSAVISENKDLSDLLGIQAVYEESVHVEGIEIFDGFLLGGDTIYKVEDENDEEEVELQDFDLDVPWYQTTTGTKTYMIGMLDKDEVENEYMPGIIWRNSVGNAKIFAVNGDYISKNYGIGILSGIVNECLEYNVYPIVNSQNLTIANFPGFANENQEKMMKIYSRTQPAVFKELVWPNIQSTIEKSHNKPTCLIMPEYDYDDANEPYASELVYYLKLLKEVNGEAGLSASRLRTIDVEDKLGRDRLYFVEQSNMYKFAAYYSEKADLQDLAAQYGTVNAKDMKTVTTGFNENLNVLSYLDDDVTLLMATVDGFSHTYSEDLRVKSLETALGYSNILLDMKRVAWPESEDDYWEKLSEKFTKYTNTYWQAFEDFNQTTLSECDRRARTMLALDYRTERIDDVVNIDIENVDDVTWFMFRTHGEEIEEIQGGIFKQVENDSYIIQANKAHVEIRLKSTYNDNYYYIDEK